MTSCLSGLQCFILVSVSSKLRSHTMKQGALPGAKSYPFTKEESTLAGYIPTLYIVGGEKDRRFEESNRLHKL